MQKLREQIAAYLPRNEQETADRKMMLSFMDRNPDCLERTNLTAHFSASGWIVNKRRDRVLLCYHKVYDSWSWTGGHADGEADLEAVALREAQEETGVHAVSVHPGRIYSLECLYVMGHEKRGTYVPCHIHMNLTYLLEADEEETLVINQDENSGVQWFDHQSVIEKPTEPWMVERVYRKLLERTEAERKMQQ